MEQNKTIESERDKEETAHPVRDAIDRFEHADPTHPPKQGFGTPLVMGIISFSIVLIIGVAVYILLSSPGSSGPG